MWRRGAKAHLDVLEIRCFVERGVVPVQVLHPAVQVGVVVADSVSKRHGGRRRACEVSFDKSAVCAHKDRRQLTFRGCT